MKTGPLLHACCANSRARLQNTRALFLVPRRPSSPPTEKQNVSGANYSVNALESINIKLLWLSLAHIKLKLWSAPEEGWLLRRSGGGELLPGERQVSPKRAEPWLWAVVGRGHPGWRRGSGQWGTKSQEVEIPNATVTQDGVFSGVSLGALWLGMCVVCTEFYVTFLTLAQDSKVSMLPRGIVPLRAGIGTLRSSRAGDGGGVASSLAASCPLLCAAPAPGSSPLAPVLTLAARPPVCGLPASCVRLPQH